MLAGEGMAGNGNMIRGDMKVTKEEIEDFLKLWGFCCYFCGPKKVYLGLVEVTLNSKVV